MDRTERFGIGEKIDSLLLHALESLRAASYASTEKELHLRRAIQALDSLRFFLQLAWESKLIPSKHYETLGVMIEEVGRMTGGWIKGLRAKTRSENPERERKE
jgi:hypothetical protein